MLLSLQAVLWRAAEAYKSELLPLIGSDMPEDGTPPPLRPITNLLVGEPPISLTLQPAVKCSFQQNTSIFSSAVQELMAV